MHTTPREVGEHVSDRGSRSGETFVGVALPIGEVDPVVTPQRLERREQACVVGRAVDEDLDPVPGAPPRGARATVDDRLRVLALAGGEEPFVETHRDELPGPRYADTSLNANARSRTAKASSSSSTDGRWSDET